MATTPQAPEELKPASTLEVLGSAAKGALGSSVAVGIAGAAAGAAIAGGLSLAGAEETVQDALHKVNLDMGATPADTGYLALGGATAGAALGATFGAGAGTVSGGIRPQQERLQQAIPLVVEQSFKNGIEAGREVGRQEAAQTAANQGSAMKSFAEKTQGTGNNWLDRAIASKAKASLNERG